VDNKPYRSLNEYYREVFGRKTAKISLDGGFTCPNRDGTCGTRGCLFCSAGGSGDFAENASLSITEQVAQGKAQTSDKWKDPAYVAYFQAFTNTYAPAEELRQKYEEALSCEGVEGLSIATRADCLPEDVLDLLAELCQKTKLWVELGLQTADETSAEYIRRGYPFCVFEKAVHDLAERNIPVIVHVILGLPGETRETILHTIDCVNHLPVQGIKLQLLHVLADSDLDNVGGDPAGDDGFDNESEGFEIIAD
jgi:radical SAM protein (TIGR01212 family)